MCKIWTLQGPLKADIRMCIGCYNIHSSKVANRLKSNYEYILTVNTWVHHFQQCQHQVHCDQQLSNTCIPRTAHSSSQKHMHALSHWAKILYVVDASSCTKSYLKTSTFICHYFKDIPWWKQMLQRGVLWSLFCACLFQVCSIYTKWWV